ncbi:hypothetical protein P0F65_18050 [Sphingomonas sp. I4]
MTAVRSTAGFATGFHHTILPIVAPVLAITAAAALLRLPIAQSHARVAALLFLWIASDAMMLGLLARARRPGWRAGIAAMASAGMAVLSLSPPPIRAALLAMPWALAVPVIAIALHGGWGCGASSSGCGNGTGTIPNAGLRCWARSFPGRLPGWR